MEKDPFKEYLKESEPDKAGKSYVVRANYTNLQRGIYETTEYLELFLRNLLLNEKNELHNRNLHVNAVMKTEKADIDTKKADIREEKADIDFESLLSKKTEGFSKKTVAHIHRIFDRFGFEEIFGRSAVTSLLALQNSSASKLISKLVQSGIIEPVAGHGKGKYKFSKQ